MAVGNLVIDHKLEVTKCCRGFIFCRKKIFREKIRNKKNGGLVFGIQIENEPIGAFFQHDEYI